jgi:transketolase
MENLKALSDGLVKLGKKSKSVVVLNADFDSKIGVGIFAQGFSDRYFNFGMAEANMMGASVGFVVRGKKPLVICYGNSVMKALDVIRNAICVPNLNVKIICVDPGESNEGYNAVGLSGMMRELKNMKVYEPVDEKEISEVMDMIFDEYGPAFVRI